MRIFPIFSISVSVLLLSCQSTEVLRPPEFDKSFSVLEKKLTLETVVANWDQSLDEISRREPASKINWQEELQRLCQSHDNLCEVGVRSSRKKEVLNKKAITEINVAFEAEKFEELKDYPVDVSLKFFAKYKKNKLISFADHLLNDRECQAPDMAHALASAMEDYLPQIEIRDLVQELYEQNSACPLTKTTTLSTYRAAMLRLVDNDCLKATPLLEKVTLSNEDYLKPRSLYWTWRCNGESAEVKSQADTLLPYFSYHRILMDEATPGGAQDSASLPEETLVLVETAKNTALNDVARLTERLIADQLLTPARAILEKIQVARIQETEPEFQVYWARLLHLSHAGIKKFQVLAPLINNYPGFRTKSVQLMLFPTLYFEQVEAHSKKLDPWLVQSLIRQESAFDPHAKSRVGATGLMQLMPATARRIAKVRGPQLKDPSYNVQAGVKFLELLVNRFDGQVPLALAAYNAGPGKIDEWKKRYPTDDIMLFVDTIPYRETREYVAFILRNYYWYRALNFRPEPETLDEKPASMLARMATQMDAF